ncbi:MAG: hypothetical protein GX575_05510 [Candidatus Anammoximicrobium sp.]|nr:hypothetical protein [Candidatus Anammoximicrobium sp.]
MDGVLSQAGASFDVATGFGPSAYFSGQPALEKLDATMEQREVRRCLRAVCPTTPGVYGMVDRAGQLVYVGMSAKLCDRLLTYFSAGDDSAKERRIAKHARQVIWEPCAHEFTAQLRELELIRRWRPRFNRRGRLDSDRCGFICLTTDEAPHFHVATRSPRDSRRSWGPVRRNRQLLAAIDRLNHVFRLRDCSREVPMRFADQLTLFELDSQAACLRGSLASCSAPCAALCSRDDYRRQIERAQTFLDGQDRQLLVELETAMREAGEHRDYEQAIRHRDALRELTFLFDQLQILRKVCRDYWFVYPVGAENGAACVWHLIAGGDVVAVVTEPRTAAEAKRVHALLAEAYLQPGRQAHLAFEAFDRVHLVASWFRRHPDELAAVLSPDEALISQRTGIGWGGRACGHELSG